MPLQDVNLNIFQGSGNPGAGWEPTTSSDGSKTFWYMYTGGNTPANNGNNESKLPANPKDAKPESFYLKFTGQLKQDFEFIGFSSSPDPAEITGSVNPDLVTVTDQNTKEGKYYWAVEVKEKSTGMTFYCDPGVINRK